MRIAVVGSHGTGKTALAKSLCDLLECHYIPDVVREAHEKKFVINEKTPPETQFWILSRQIELERNTPEPWISDKSLFDNAIYGGFSGLDNEVLNVIRKIIFSNVYYDLIFYLPVEFPLEDDGLRSLSPDFQRRIDEEFRLFLQENKVEFTELSGLAETRSNQALRQIASKALAAVVRLRADNPGS